MPLKSWSCHFRGKLQRDLEAVFQVVGSICVSQSAQLGLLDKFLHFRGSTANSLRTLDNVAVSFGTCTEPNPPDPSGDVGQDNMLVPLFHFTGDSGCCEVHKVQKGLASQQLRLDLIARTFMPRTKTGNEGDGLGSGRPQFWVALGAFGRAAEVAAIGNLCH